MMGLIDDIKKEATGNGTKIQSSEAAKLEKILNNLFYLPKDIEEETKFVKQVMTRGLESQERVGLHASAMLVGDKQFCMRAQVLSLLFKQLQGKQVQVGLMRIFEEGNAIHEKWQRLFIRGGFGKARNMDYTRMYEPYMMSFTPDIVCRIPEFFEGAMVGEIKSVNTFAFKKQVKHPSAWKQCQWYMHLCIKLAEERGKWNGVDYTRGFVLSEDKNTQGFKCEVYDFEYDLIEQFDDRANEIIYNYDEFMETKKMVKRPKDATKPDCKRCKECFMRDACWNIGDGRVRL